VLTILDTAAALLCPLRLLGMLRNGCLKGSHKGTTPEGDRVREWGIVP